MSFLKKYLSKRSSKIEVKIPISKEKNKKSKLAEKQKKLDNSLKQVKVLKGKQMVFMISNNAIALV
jgi:hypothetical protein